MDDEVVKRDVNKPPVPTPPVTVSATLHPYPGLIFHLLNKRRPAKVRRRFSRLYWKAWSRLVLSFFLLSFGITFLIIGFGCVATCEETSRAFAFMLVSALMLMPGAYSAAVLVNYLRCVPGFTYKDLPGE